MDISVTDLKNFVQSISTNSISVVLKSGHILHGKAELVSKEDSEVKLETGGKLVFIPLSDIVNVSPLYCDISNNSPDDLANPALGTALVHTTHSRAKKLNYPIQEKTDVLSRDSGFGSFEIEATNPSAVPSFTNKQLIYIENEYLEIWVEEYESWMENQLKNVTATAKLPFMLALNYDLQDISTTSISEYIERPEPITINEATDHSEPIITGYLELIEQNGEHVFREFPEAGERVGVIVTPEKISQTSQLKSALVAWFSPRSLAVTVDCVDPLDNLKTPVRLRGQTWDEDFIELSSDRSDDSKYISKNMIVRAAMVVNE